MLTSKNPGNAPESGEIVLKGASGGAGQDYYRGDKLTFIVEGIVTAQGVKDETEKGDPTEVKTSVRTHGVTTTMMRVATEKEIKAIERANIGEVTDTVDERDVGAVTGEMAELARHATLELTGSSETANSVALQVENGLRTAFSREDDVADGDPDEPITDDPEGEPVLNEEDLADLAAAEAEAEGGVDDE